MARLLAILLIVITLSCEGDNADLRVKDQTAHREHTEDGATGPGNWQAPAVYDRAAGPELSAGDGAAEGTGPGAAEGELDARETTRTPTALGGGGGGIWPTAEPSPSPVPGMQVHGDAGVWAHLARIRDCESGFRDRDGSIIPGTARYDINTGNGHYGAYQFTLGTWRTVGGTNLPSEAAPEEQDYRAYILYTQYGPHHWPVCSLR